MVLTHVLSWVRGHPWLASDADTCTTLPTLNQLAPKLGFLVKNLPLLEREGRTLKRAHGSKEMRWASLCEYDLTSWNNVGIMTEGELS